ncbi:aldose 1-epimerase [Lutibacter sp. Hel_I_33_5]|uniref:aldose 1-epimerase n=1 Tax=Lutibacter sp. Hel_I_33_5 TaxID=1566289 RepID=UPI0011A5D0AE|nr:aldose 1-epimerase [Lutibacter sp. Hel_I_33_5]TVZ55988.1 aldose 1-epimerase [Lutibacter sp. Hel_I_33_5]
MYTIKQNNHHLIIENTQQKVYSKIHLNEGASLQELTLNGHALITDLSPLTYSDTYASSILFPFASRIRDGKYEFNGEKFQLDTNQREEKNALHGLVYNKLFTVLKKEEHNDYAAVLLEYVENDKSQGFPFTYTIQIEYRCTQTELSVKINVKNTDDRVFPFTIGWHPYFNSSDLYSSYLDFNSDKTLTYDAKNITKEVVDFNNDSSFTIEDKQLDNCFLLKDNSVEFTTPKYRFSIESSAKENFLQVYTPPKKNIIAIEPTTGVADSFNNNIGLQTLASNEVYKIDWTLKLKNI